MLNRMRHIEIHVIENETDTLSACNSGLLNDPFVVAACSDCGDDVGALEVFEPYCLVLDGESEWFLCTYCAEPVTNPELDHNFALDASHSEADDEDDDSIEFFTF